MKYKKILCSCVGLVSFSISSLAFAEEGAAGYKPRVEPKVEKGSLEDAAKSLGFAARLPKGGEFYMGVQDVNAIIDAFTKGKIGRLIEKLAPEGAKMSQLMEQEGFKKFRDVAGEDVFFSGGKGTSSIVALYAELNREFTRMQGKMLLNMFMMNLKGEGDEEQMASPFGMPEFLTDKDGAVRLLDELEVAPFYAGFKVSDKGQRAELLKTLHQALENSVLGAPEILKSANSERYKSFSGFSLSGKNVSKMKEMFLEQLDAEVLEMYEKAISKHDVVVLVGEEDDYIVFFTGKSANEMEFAANVESSLVANEGASFYRNYSHKKVHGSIYMSKDFVASAQAFNGALGVYCELLAVELAGTGLLGDTRELQYLLILASKKEKELYDLMPACQIGFVAYKEDGYKVDVYYGDEYPSLDLDSPRQLAAMAYHKDAFISASMVGKEGYSKAVVEYLEVLFKTFYKGAQVTTYQNFTGNNWLHFVEIFSMVDSDFAEDLAFVWSAFKNGVSGLGSEQALMLDFKGRLPRVPNVPSAVLDGGPVPRLALAYDVVDRSKLSASWVSIAKAADNMANTYSEIFNQKLSLPRPERLKEAGLDIWSYQLGVTTKDANLALGVSDKLFYLTTSPSYIIQRVAESAGAAAPAGAEFTINMAPLRSAASEWLDLLDKKGEDFMSAGDWQKFQEQKNLLKDVIEASRELKKIDVYTRKVEGKVKSTLHIQTE